MECNIKWSPQNFLITQSQFFYGFPTGMLKLILSATAPHSALFMVKTDIQAMIPTSQTRAPNPLAITSFFIVA